MSREPVTVSPQYSETHLDNLQHGEKGLSATSTPPAPQSFPEGGLRGWSTVVGAYVQIHLNSVTLNQGISIHHIVFSRFLIQFCGFGCVTIAYNTTTDFS